MWLTLPDWWLTFVGICNIRDYQLASNTPLSNIVSPHASGTDNIPKAYLSVLFFDERFNFVSEGSTSQRVSGADNSNAALTLANIKAPKNGYAYIYVSNESDEYVYFDNVKVAHTRGRIIEENHYYAFGLKIAGISSKKLGDDNEGSLRNEYGYNDKELWEEGDLNWLDYGFRNYDPQIGRFPQLDPLTDDYPFLTPYQYASNDPITNIDIDGLEGMSSTGLVDVVVKNSSRIGINQILTISKSVGIKVGVVGLSEVSKRILDGHKHRIPQQMMIENLRDPNEAPLSSNPADYKESHSWKIFEKVLERIEQDAWQSQGGNKWKSKLTGEIRYKSQALIHVYPESVVYPIPKLRFVYKFLGRSSNAAKNGGLVDDAYVHITTPEGAKNILSKGLDPEISGFVTKWKYVKNITNGSDFNTMLYSQKLWSQTAKKFDKGFNILHINAKPSFFSPRTNWINGIPQYKFHSIVDPSLINKIK
jgi:RHS repeat-associated protein